METGPNVLIVGASARAAAFSALRAGLRPWCADLFADVDLQAVCPAVTVGRRDYPAGLASVVAQAPQAPLIYTGALENRPKLIGRLAKLRPLWGNGPEALRRVRRPWTVEAVLRRAGLPCPRTWQGRRRLPPDGGWLVKPPAGAGGRGVAWLADVPESLNTAKVYVQEHVEGNPCAAVYVGG